jgi:hypothetical protein
MCADKFRQFADTSANMAELKKVSSWMQVSYIEKGGWGHIPRNDLARRRTSVRHRAHHFAVSFDTAGARRSAARQ